MRHSGALQVHIVNNDDLSLIISAAVALATFLVASVAVWQILKDSRQRARDAHLERYQREADAVIEAVAATANAAALFTNVLPVLRPLQGRDDEVTPEGHERARVAVEAVEPSRQAAHSARLRVRVLSGSGDIYDAVDRLVSVIDGQRGAARAWLKWAEPGAQRTGPAPDRQKLVAPDIGEARRQCIDIAYHLARGQDPPARPRSFSTIDLSVDAFILAMEIQAVQAHRKFFGLGYGPEINAEAVLLGDVLEVSVEGQLFGFDDLEGAARAEIEKRFEAFRTRATARRIRTADSVLLAHRVKYDVSLRTEPIRVVEKFTLVPLEGSADPAPDPQSSAAPRGRATLFTAWLPRAQPDEAYIMTLRRARRDRSSG